jgi:hypothetical protein
MMIKVGFIDLMGLKGYGIGYVRGRSWANVLTATSCKEND